MDGDADGKRRTVEGQKAGFGFYAYADGGSDDERLVDAAYAGDAGQGLHDHAETDGNAVEGELGPGAEWIGREGALTPGLVRNVVIGLLGGGAREVGRGGFGVGGDVEMKERVGLRARRILPFPTIRRYWFQTKSWREMRRL